MAKYRNVELEDNLAGLFRHMDSVEEYREVLQGLQMVWDNLTLLGQMSGTGTDMSGTRQAFNQLTSALLNRLAGETLHKCVQEIGAKAQVAIDILVRNLFERTADIGFLATDDDIRAYLQDAAGGLDGEPLAARRARLEARFADYVAKYSVYSDIVLLAPTGQVLARLDRTAAPRSSSAGLLRVTLDTGAPYVETFAAIDLFPDQARSLVYSCRVGPRSAPLGVLCLCFRFANEMDAIFAKLCAPDDWSVVTLVDPAGVVVASSDPWQVAVGARVPGNGERPWCTARFAGREYLVATRVSQGYQGYPGPGWRGQVLVPLQHAFADSRAAANASQSREVLEAVMRGATLFGEQLRRIPQQAERIQADLNRSVWNGNLRQRGAGAAPAGAAAGGVFPKVLLWEISNTGARTKEVFERSIDNLHQTVLSATLEDCAFHAALATDIMDRNLYERANDCRWWALTSEFRQLLAAPAPEQGAAARIGEILAGINALYTVYTNLLVFDAEGRVIAVSNPADQALVGCQLGEDWQRRALALPNAQAYTVSTFAPTPLYGDRPTYIYAAAIRSPDDTRVVGGVGIVFDGAPQFLAMLRDALPRDTAGQVRAGALAVFVDEGGRVIASTDARLAPGTRLALADDWFRLAPGERRAAVLALDGQYHAAGACASLGYREYKGPDDPYRNPVTAVVLVPLCAVSAQATLPVAVRPVVAREAVADQRQRVELASFRIGAGWYALPVGEVVQSIEAAGLTAMPGGGALLAGCLHHAGETLAVFDLDTLLGEPSPAASSSRQRQVVVVNDGVHAPFGILVDELGDIPEVGAHRLTELPSLLGGNSLLTGTLSPGEGAAAAPLLLILGAARIHARVSRLAATPRPALAR